MKKNFLLRLWQYVHLRFPFFSVLLLTLLVGLSVSLLSWRLGFEHSYILVVLIAFMFFIFLFKLMVLDELKDFAHDSKYYPDRPIQKGLLSLLELKLLGITAFLIELLITLFLGYGISLTVFVLASIYTFFMYKEFFVGAFIKSKLLLYLILHELVFVFVYFWLFFFGINNPFTINRSMFWQLILFILTIVLIEVARKSRFKLDENASKDTYSARYGLHFVSIVLVALSCLLSVSLFLFMESLSYLLSRHLIFSIFLSSFPLPFVLNYLNHKSRDSSKTLFYGISIYCVFVYLGMIIFLKYE